MEHEIITLRKQRPNEGRELEEEEEDDTSSQPGTKTPRPSYLPNNRSRVAGSRIGSGATPCFQPGQRVPPIDTQTADRHRTPDRSQSESIAMDRSPHISNSSSSAASRAASGHFNAGSWETNYRTPLTPHYAPEHVVESPVDNDRYPRETSGAYAAVQRFTNACDIPDQAHPMGATGLQHANYRHASQFEESPSERTVRSPSFSRRAPSREMGRTPKRQGRHSDPKDLRNQHARASHTNSRTWVSNQMEEQERWKEIDGNLRQMELIPRSPFVPHDFKQWVGHRAGRHEDEMNEARRKTQIREETRGLNHVDPAFEGKKFVDGRSSVLSQQTIWQPHLEPQNMEYAMAEWPSCEEMKEEGDERNTSRFGRFLSLPRSPAKDTTNWKAKPRVQSTALDSVWALPSVESVQRSREQWAQGDTAQGEGWISHGLIEGIECEPEIEER